MKHNKLCLEESIQKSFSKSTNSVIACKSAFIGTCTEIDRFFRVILNINIGKRITEKSFSLIVAYYPGFACFNVEQFSQLMSIFLLIRNYSAHLYATGSIRVDETMIYAALLA